MKFNKFAFYFIISASLYFLNGCGGSQTEVVEESDEPVTIETFKETLTPYGEWIKVTTTDIDPDAVSGDQPAIDNDISVEYIWRPNPAFIYAGWNPYCNGRWVWTDWGWTWVSNYEWGWAPFHYGRWWWSGVYGGWVWSPGFRWAPAWVTWRFAENHVGWYPLSPRIGWSVGVNISNVNYNYRNENWTFVERANFTHVVNNETIVDVNRNNDIVKNSSQEMNMQQQNNKIINKGPDVQNIEKASGEKIQQRTVGESSVKGQSKISDNSVSIYKGKNTVSKNKGKNKNKNNKGNEGNDIYKEKDKHK